MNTKVSTLPALKNKLSLQIWGTTLISVGCSVVALVLVFSKESVSHQQLTARQKALVNITKHVKSETCWTDNSDVAYKIGDPLITPGSETGKIPTSCVIAPKVNQYLEVAYKDSELQVIRIYSGKEVNAQLSQLRKKK